jgi:hypothetical protein
MLFLLRPNSPNRAQAASFLRFLDHSQKHHTQHNSSGQAIGPTQRPLHDSTQQTQETDIHHHGGIYNTIILCVIVFIRRHEIRIFYTYSYVQWPVKCLSVPYVS